MIGPHEGKELELMVAGKKPLSMFESIEGEDVFFPEHDFDSLVTGGRLIKCVSLSHIKLPDGTTGKLRRVMYALKEEEWRIKALQLVLGAYETLLPGWRPDFERIIGVLLGYAREDVEEFVEKIQPPAEPPSTTIRPRDV